MKNESFRGEEIQKQGPFLSSTEEAGQPAAHDLLNVFEGLGAGIILIDQGCLVTYANTAAARLLKKEGSPLQGQALRDIAEGGFRQLLQEKAEFALCSHAEVCFEAFCPDPVISWFHCRCLPYSNGAAVVFEDITLRGKAADARKRHHENTEQRLGELDAIYHTAPVGLCVIDEHNRFIRMNERLADFNGVPAAEHIGRSVREMAPSIADKAEDILQTVLKTGKPMRDVDFTGSTLAEPDVQKSVVMQFFPLTDGSGRAVGVSVVVEEVTQLEQAYHALAASEERYRVLYDSMSQGVVEYDAQGRIASSNRAAREISGIDIEKLNGIPLREAFAALPEVRREDGSLYDVDSIPTLLSLATGREVRNTIARVMVPGRNECLWVSHDAIPWFAPGQDKPGGVFAIFSDITELKNIQEALLAVNEDLEQKVHDQTGHLRRTIETLEKQKEILQTVFDSIPLMLFFYDTSLRMKMINREFERLTGWMLENDGNKNLLAATFPDPERRREACDFMAKAEGVWREFDIVTRSGEILASSWMSLRLPDKSRIGIGIDLRLHKKMGNDLAKFAAAVEQARDGIALIGAGGGGLIEYINPAFEAMTGYRRHEVVGRPLRSFSDYLADDRHQEMYDLVTSQAKAWSGRQKRRRKNGEVYEASLSVTPVRDETGRVINYVAVVRDVTRETRLQQQLFQIQKMEALGTLAGGISHDLKNIFTPILLDTEVLMQDMGVQNPFYPILDEIHKATSLGIDLVNQILTFSRNVRHEKAPVDLYPVVRQVLSFLRASLPSVIDIDHQLQTKGACIMADPTQIQQVVMNLGSNAKHAMRETGGLLTVRLDTVDLDEKAASEVCSDLAPGSYVEISIKDTGEGMDKNTLERIFDPFFTTKKKGEGSGLGLAVVHGIVKEHNGAISVWSRPGQGSVFRVLLPRIEGQALGKKRTRA